MRVSSLSVKAGVAVKVVRVVEPCNTATTRCARASRCFPVTHEGNGCNQLMRAR